MEPTDEKFDISKCRTHRVFASDIYWCLACRTNQLYCRHIMGFGYSFLCRHPARSEFAEREQEAQVTKEGSEKSAA